MGHVSETTLLSGIFCRPHRLGLATINLYTKFEVSMFTDYEDVKCDEKFRNLGRVEV